MKKYLKIFLKRKHLLSKRLHIIAGGFVVVLLLFLFLLMPTKQQIGIVDMARVYEQAAVFKAIYAEQIAIENEWKKQALAQKEELLAADKALSKKKSNMKKKKFETEVAVLKNKILDFQNQQMAKLDLIRHQSTQLQRQVLETMKPIIAQIASTESLDFVISSSNVLYYSKATDVTDDVIDALNEAFEDEKLPKLQISLEKGV